jgi:hypothetical protein
MLDSAAVERVAKIKVDVDKERKLVAKLEAQITEQRAKDLLDAARSYFDMVEGYFLDEKILGEGRAPGRIAAWLNEAEKALRPRALPQRTQNPGLPLATEFWLLRFLGSLGRGRITCNQ